MEGIKEATTFLNDCFKAKRVEARVSCGYTVIDFDLVSFLKGRKY